jgi:hypothetical protein
MARTKHTVYKSTGEWIPKRPDHGGKAPRQQLNTGCARKTVRPGSLTSWAGMPKEARKSPPRMGKGHVLLFFDGKRQELCLCIIEEGNDPVNKENRTQKPYNARLFQGNRQNTTHTHDNSWHVICAGYKSP